MRCGWAWLGAVVAVWAWRPASCVETIQSQIQYEAVTNPTSPTPTPPWPRLTIAAVPEGSFAPHRPPTAGPAPAPDPAPAPATAAPAVTQEVISTPSLYNDNTAQYVRYILPSGPATSSEATSEAATRLELETNLREV